MDKIALFIVEGATDKRALESIFRKIYRNRTVRFEFTHGDVTSDETINKQNVKDEIYKYVKSYMDINKIKRNDIWQIVQIFDMDGAYVDPSNIVEGDTREIFYTENEISCKNPEKIRLRNEHKKELMDYLLNEPDIKGIPYEGYYMSCNLDHALYGLLNLSDDEKKKQADTFYSAFWEHPELFLPFLEKYVVNGVPQNFPASWRYIKTDKHSLERHTNLNLYFSKHPVL
ncbi:hypothetical protein LI221_10265 [Faecalimonas umbilicata]|nr:hypothetical protein [Faecalimonas umbilicata]